MIKKSFLGLLCILLCGNILAQAKVETDGDTKTLHATYYANKFNNRRTANGEVFSNQRYTCASKHYPFGTYLLVTNPRNGKEVVVRVNDRMSPRAKASIDLARVAAQQIGLISQGIGKVTVRVIDKETADRMMDLLASK